jgi:glycosyltransferase involved in cell wall biosynthesis
MKISVIINNRDLYTWPVAMVQRILKYDNVGDVIIVDNGSTYPPLIHWYDRQTLVPVKRCENLGHGGAWVSGAVSELRSEYYVVTDSDLGLQDTPDDTLMVLLEKLQNQPDLGKIGLGLNWQIVFGESPYYNRLMLYESDRWNKSRVIDDVYVDVQIDTTFALYNKPNYFIGGGSMTFPYVARHYPWELTKKEYEANDEFKYYIKNASHSCSYKTLLQLT